MKIYSDISLRGISQSISQDQNKYVLVRDDSGYIVRQVPLTVNGASMNANGNITTALTSVLVGPSASGAPNNLIGSSSGAITASIANGTVWVVANDSSTPDPDGQAFIFVSQSTEFTPPRGKWYPLDTLNQTQADLRYVKLSSATTQTISSSLIISGSDVTFSSSLFWSGASNLGGAANNVLVLGNDGKIYITGSYGAGGGGGPSENVIKAGIVAFGSFAGTPRTATVTFTTPMADANYGVSVIGGDARSWTIDSKLVGSFIINTNSSVALTNNVSWIAAPTNNP